MKLCGEWRGENGGFTAKTLTRPKTIPPARQAEINYTSASTQMVELSTAVDSSASFSNPLGGVWGVEIEHGEWKNKKQEQNRELKIKLLIGLG